MRRNRIKRSCVVCKGEFETRHCEVKTIVTCSRECSLRYRSINAAGRLVTWGDRIAAGLRGKKREWTPDENYRQRMRELALARGMGRDLKGKKLSEEHRRKMSEAQRGHARGGWKLSAEIRRKMSESRRGAASHLWRGGIYPEEKRLRHSFEYVEWRKAVYVRDDYTCTNCGQRGGKLNADHIKPYALFPELRLDVSNGRTLCVPCHRQTATWGKSGVALRKACFGIEVQVVKREGR